MCLVLQLCQQTTLFCHTHGCLHGGFLDKEIRKLNICNTLNLYKEYHKKFIVGNSDLKFRNLPVTGWNTFNVSLHTVASVAF